MSYVWWTVSVYAFPLSLILIDRLSLFLPLYRQGYTTSVRSVAAMALADELTKTQAPAGYTIPPLAKDILRGLAESSQ